MIMKKTLLCVCSVMLCLLLCTAMADADERTVTVSGTATVKVPADRAQVYLGVQTRGESAAEAAKENAERMDQLVQALTDAGIERKSIVTQSYSVDSIYDYSGAVPEQIGYEVNNRLAITMEDIAKVGDLIDVGLAHGANQCNGLNFYSSKEDEAKDAALVAAVQEGMRRAGLVAAGCGKELGELVSVEESYTMGGGVVNALTLDRSGKSTSIFANNLEYTATVSVTLELR